MSGEAASSRRAVAGEGQMRIAGRRSGKFLLDRFSFEHYTLSIRSQRDDRRQFLSGDPGLKASQTKPLTTGNGQVLQSYTFFPKGKGNWEQAYYGNEGEYYLIFVVSARTQAGFTKALEAYKKFIARYKKKL